MRPIDIRKLTKRETVDTDYRLTIDENNNECLTRQPDALVLGTAASKDVGLGQDEIETNALKDFKSFDSLTSAIAYVTANPDNIKRLDTASYRNEAECLALSINYPDGGDASYVVVASGTGADDGGSFIDAGTKQLKNALENINQLHFGCDREAAEDCTAKFNAYIAYQKAKIVTLASTYVIPAVITFAAGRFSVSSLNMTGFNQARNVSIQAHGCTIEGNMAGKNIIDCLKSRWLWFWGLTVHSSDLVAARSGFQLGAAGTETVGNNKLFACQALGYYTKAPYMNLGSETTQLYSCRFANYQADAGTYAGICDGLALAGFEPTSDYVTITRTTGQALSFTNNSHYGCQFRHIGGGSSLFLSKSDGWLFDKSTYFLCFRGVAVRIYSTSVYRNSDLSLLGLFETAQTGLPDPVDTGLLHGIAFAGDGTQTIIAGFELSTRRPHNSGSFFTFENVPTARILSANIKIGSLEREGGGAKVFPIAAPITITGSISTAKSSIMNLDDITGFYGDIHCDDITPFLIGITGSYTVSSEGETVTRGISSVSQKQWINVTVTANNINVSQELITLPASTETILTLDNSVSGARVVTFRQGNGVTATFTHDTSKLRNISGANVVLGVHESITYTHISGSIWQQTGGKI